MIGDRVCPSRPLRRVTIYTMLYCTHGVCLKIRPFRFPLLMAARVRARITWMMQANPHVNDAIRATPLYRYRNGRWRCWSRRVNDRDTSTVRSDLSGYDVAAEFVSVVLERGPATRDSAEVVVGDEGGVAGG